MGRKGIYSGWTQTGTRRVWVRVPESLKQNGNGNDPTANHWNGNAHRPDGVVTDQIPIVMVHGIGVSSRSFEPLLLALGESRPVFAPDLPGFGHSDAPVSVLDVPGLADALRQWMLDHRVAPAVLVASASGCQIAIDLAARHPELVERLVLVGPTMDPEGRSAAELARRWALSVSRDSVRRAPGAVRDLLDAGPWRTIRTLERAFDDPTERKLPRIEAPTLVLRGQRDRLTPESWAKRIADAIPAAELQTIPAAPRASAASSAPALADRVEKFLATTAAIRGAANSEQGVQGDRLIVDGMNVIGSRPDGWWRDRPKAWRDLRRDLEHYAKDSRDDILLVLDGRRPAGWREDGLVETAFAGSGRDAADDSIVARVEADPHPETLRVVTSDRGLAGRVERLGAETLAASTFRSRL